MDSSIDVSEGTIKRNTDCVYFLASPLTCKKGSECEFRHSEIARLNPRECWYWLNGSCLNPTCAFRHPPLEGYSENPPESAQSRAYATNKSIAPCYFYFNAHCIKGDQCPFMHDLAPAKKVTNPAADLSIARSLDNGTSFGSDTGIDKNPAGSDTGPASVEVPADPTDDASDVIKQIDFRIIAPQPVTDNHVEESPSAESSSPEYEKPAVNPHQYIDFDNGEPVCADQSSEEIENECTERDEWLESSPGFDVLVDNGLEEFAPDEDEADYLLGHEREPERLHTHLFQYDFRDSAGYDHLNCPDIGYAYDQGIYDSYNHPAVDRRSPEYFHVVSEIPRERMLEPMFQRKRRPLHRNCRDGHGMDLRDHLRKRSKVDTSRRQHNSRSRSRSREHIQPYRPFHQGRLASEIRRKMSVSSHSDTDSGLKFRFSQSRLNNSQPGRYYRSDRRERGDRRERISQRRNNHPSPALYSEVHRISNEKMSSRRANEAAFSGPKTLAQIREENNRVVADSNPPIRHTRNLAPEFEGPRPLSEILDEKRKSMLTALIAGDATGTKLAQDAQINSQGDNREYDGSGDYQSDFVDDDDEEDGFHTKLASVLGQ